MSVREHYARRLVRRRSGGWCETCDRRAATDWHHRKNRSQGGQWSAANGLHVCRICHEAITTGPADAVAKGWAVPSHGDPARARVWLARWGWCLLSDAGDITPLEKPAWSGGLPVRLDPSVPHGTAYLLPIRREER